MTAAINLDSEDTDEISQQNDLTNFAHAPAKSAASTPQNRRQIFRIADPEFATMKVLVHGIDGPAECTCLDISAVGLGLLVPAAAFNTAEPGTILEYEISFGPLSPVKGIAIVANRADTSLVDERGSLLRLGLRFGDAEHSRSENIVAKRRRSERYYLPAAMRPICVCNDPLWFGQLLTISILDFSQHGMSGVVSAKKTVFAEGLRTVFQLAFPYFGVIEVPVRVIYANPTDDPSVFRIGCEFVRRSDEFTQAAQLFLKMFCFASDEQRIILPFSSYFRTPGQLVSNRQEIEDASSQFLETSTEFSSSRHVEIFPLLAKIKSKYQKDNCYFRFELHLEHQSDQIDGQEEEPLLGRQYLFICLDDFKTTHPSDLQKIFSFIIYFGILKKAHSLKAYAAHETDRAELFNKLESAGFLSANLTAKESEREYAFSDIKTCNTISRSLWLRAIMCLANFDEVFSKRDLKLDSWGWLIFRCACVLIKLHSTLFKFGHTDSGNKGY